jgi:hypothetical protein
MKQLAFQNSTHALLTWFLDPRSKVLDLEGAHRPAAVAVHIASCYRELGTPAPAGVAVEKRGLAYDGRAYRREDRDFRRLVAELLEFVEQRMAPHLTHFFLHGSLATLDYAKGWSDVDSFMVIRQQTGQSAAELLDLRRLCLESWNLFLRICPLQHHGYILAVEGELLRYPSHYLPPPVFDHALATLPGQTPVRFHVVPGEGSALRSLVDRRDALREALRDGVLRHHPRDGVYLEARYRNAHDAMGQLFALLGYVMTVPAFLMDALGRPCHKRDSFAQARPLISKEAWEVVDKATEVRRAWGLKEGNVYRGNAIPAWIPPILGPDYFEASLCLLEEAVVLAERSANGSRASIARARP